MAGFSRPMPASMSLSLKSAVLRWSALIVQVINKKGEWETVIENPDFPWERIRR